MDDRHPEAIAIEIGGETRRLKIGPLAFRLAEMAGATITLGDIQEPTLATLTQLVWVGLLPDDFDLEERTVLKWLSKGSDEQEMAAISAVAKVLGRMATDLSAAMEGRKGTGKKRTPRKRS